jgi:hypothetical protein
MEDKTVSGLNLPMIQKDPVDLYEQFVHNDCSIDYVR